MSQPDITNESKLWGVSIRSWTAALVILSGMATVCWLAIESSDPQWVLVLASSAIGFLFGKAAGAAQKAVETQ